MTCGGNRLVGFGDAWTCTAIDADSKLTVSWMVGKREARYASAFMNDLASRLAHRVHLTTDGHPPYLQAVEDAFGCDVDYAMLVKIYGPSQEETRYSPAECVGCEKRTIPGSPDPVHVSASYVERANMTMRMSMRRFTLLTNAFSEKVENLEHAMALHFMFVNIVRIHQTLRCLPAQEAGVTDKLWSIEDIVALVD
jgi:IS1 family transposase